MGERGRTHVLPNSNTYGRHEGQEATVAANAVGMYAQVLCSTFFSVLSTLLSKEAVSFASSRPLPSLSAFINACWVSSTRASGTSGRACEYDGCQAKPEVQGRARERKREREKGRKGDG